MNEPTTSQYLHVAKLLGLDMSESKRGFIGVASGYRRIEHAFDYVVTEMWEWLDAKTESGFDMKPVPGDGGSNYVRLWIELEVSRPDIRAIDLPDALVLAICQVDSYLKGLNDEAKG